MAQEKAIIGSKKGRSGAPFGRTAGLILGLAAFATAPMAHAGPTLTTLYSFQDAADGSTPAAGVSLRNGVVYGATYRGSLAPYGVAFSLTPPRSGSGAWRYAAVLDLTGFDPGVNDFPLQCNQGIGGANSAAGANPLARPAFDKRGHMFVIASGRGCASGWGTIVQLAQKGTAWSTSAIYEFGPPRATATFGANPIDYGGPAVGPDGTLYATTSFGGGNGCGGGAVLAFAPGLAGDPTALHFSCAGDYFDYEAGLTLAHDGALYGAAAQGGQNDAGAIFAIAKGVYSVLYRFTGVDDGSKPSGPPVIGHDGALYGAVSGTTNTGPQASGIYRLSKAKGAWNFQTIYKFGQVANDPSASGPLTVDKDGALWSLGDNGRYLCGAIIKLTPPAVRGGAWTETLPYSFGCGADGANPRGPVAIDGKGSVYGATVGGTGPAVNGTVFKFTP